MTADPTIRYAVGDPDPTPILTGAADYCNAPDPARSRRLTCTWPAGHAHPQHVAGGGTILAVWDVTDPDPAEPTVAAEHDADHGPGDRLPPRPRGTITDDVDVPEGVKLRPTDDVPLPPEPLNLDAIRAALDAAAAALDDSARLAAAANLRAAALANLPEPADLDPHRGGE